MDDFDGEDDDGDDDDEDSKQISTNAMMVTGAPKLTASENRRLYGRQSGYAEERSHSDRPKRGKKGLASGFSPPMTGG